MSESLSMSIPSLFKAPLLKEVGISLHHFAANILLKDIVFLRFSRRVEDRIFTPTPNRGLP